MDSTTPVGRTEDAARAAQQLDTALKAVGSRYLHMPDVSSAATVLIFGEGRTPDSYLGPWTVPLAVVPDEARALERTLGEYRISVTVTIAVFEMWEPGDTLAFRLEFPTADDTARFATLLIAHLPEPAATAHRLRTALKAAGINQWVGFSNGQVDLETVEAVDAAALCDILGTRVGETIRQDLDTADWHLMEQLATEISAALSTVLGEEIEVDSLPVCRTCDRDNWMEVGSISLEAAQRLASAIEAATTPASDSPSPELVPAPGIEPKR